MLVSFPHGDSEVFLRLKLLTSNLTQPLALLVSFLVLANSSNFSHIIIFVVKLSPFLRYYVSLNISNEGYLFCLSCFNIL